MPIMIITELPVPFPLVEMGDNRVLEIPRNSPLATHPQTYRRMFRHQSGTAALVDFDRDRVGSLCTAQIVSDPCGSTFFAKGAPDQLIKRCAYYRSASTRDGRRQLGQVEALTEAMTNTLLAEAEKMGSTGLRVLALAEGERSAEDLIFAGLVGLMDPPRSDVEQAIQTCFISGVRVIMITGDSKETACAIGARLSLYRPGDLCLSGDEVESMDLNQLQARMHSVTVFYRTGPRHKCKIVKSSTEIEEIGRGAALAALATCVISCLRSS
ncbi:unnamed protein product [Schistocephalus solidus]|uniref:Cation_ATPase_C domain-containing protein n=1 Tax=Schistocephalus solidus TaxID=70667 RepID=A0A183TP94_SCHSO|nr:unnamed protein product [Schistocephalus solidus]